MNTRFCTRLSAAAVSLGFLFAPQARAQDASDALRYSFTNVQGTARSMGFGNALGSVGGDFASLSVNPAGIGIYRSSDLMITPSVHFSSAIGNYSGGGDTRDAGGGFKFDNLGGVFCNAKRGNDYEKRPWKSVSFGIGYNRTADFTRNYTYAGNNNTSSFSQSLVDEANMELQSNYSSIQTEGTTSYGVFNSFIADYDTNVGLYTIVPYQAGIRQQKTVRERGGMSELLFAFGGNYQEKLMLGVTVGLPILRYVRTTDYTETDINNAVKGFGSFTFSDRLTTTGIGINAKLGVIYKPVDNFRVGLAIHTPTAIALSDVYERSLYANSEGFAQTDLTYLLSGSTFSYSITTPWKPVVSGTVLLGRAGFITADYEYVDYSFTRFNYGGNGNTGYQQAESYVNSVIRSTYKAASNFRAGIEGRLDLVALRGGFGFYGNPYQKGGSDRIDFSAGIGFRFPATYIDLAYVHSQYTNPDQPYDLTGISTAVVPVASVITSNNTVALTLGVRF